MSTATKRWLSKPEAADHIGISEKTLRRLTAPDKTGKRALNVYHPVPGRAVLDREELDAYILHCRADPDRPKVISNPTGRNGSQRDYSGGAKKKAAA